jgi:cholesterol oxidase
MTTTNSQAVVKLLDPCKAKRDAFMRMAQEWLDHGNDRYRLALEDFDAYLVRLDRLSDAAQLPAGWVPAAEFWLEDDTGEIVACVRLRAWLTPSLEIEGGHIGYSNFDNAVAPTAVESAPSAIASQVPVSLMSTALSLVPERGAIRYDASLGDVTIDWAADGNQRAANAALAIAARLNAANPGSSTFTQPVLGPGGLSSGLTYHPLGGAVIGQTTDPYGRVKGEGNLYIMDGALLPGSCACVNPSFTIAALAERNIDRIIDEDLC